MEDLEVLEDTQCPQCGGEGRLLGELGIATWYRCRNCGWEWSMAKPLDDEEAPR